MIPKHFPSGLRGRGRGQRRGRLWSACPEKYGQGAVTKQWPFRRSRGEGRTASSFAESHYFLLRPHLREVSPCKGKGTSVASAKRSGRGFLWRSRMRENLGERRSTRFACPSLRFYTSVSGIMVSFIWSYFRSCPLVLALGGSPPPDMFTWMGLALGQRRWLEEKKRERNTDRGGNGRGVASCRDMGGLAGKSSLILVLISLFFFALSLSPAVGLFGRKDSKEPVAGSYSGTFHPSFIF